MRYQSDANIYEERNRQAQERIAPVRENRERAQQLREQYGYDYSIQQYGALANAIDNEIINEDQAWDILSAQAISDNLRRHYNIDMPASYVFENLDAFKQEFLGTTERPSKTAFRAILDSFAISASNARQNILGIHLMMARNQHATAWENTLRRQIEEEREFSYWKGDNDTRNFLLEGAKFAAQSSIHMLGIMAANFVVPGSGFLASSTGVLGSTYIELDEAGVNHEVNLPITLGTSALRGYIESSLLGNAAGLLGRTGASTLQANIANRISNTVVNKLHVNGTVLGMATGVIGRYLLEGGGEFVEEALDEIAGIIGVELAAAIQKEGITLERNEYFDRIVEAGMAGLKSAIFLGIPGLSIDTIGSVQDYRLLKDDAYNITNEEQFKNIHRESPLKGNMTDQQWSEELSKIYNGIQNIRSTDQLAEMAREAPNEAVFREMVNDSIKRGFRPPIPENIKPEEEQQFYNTFYENEQSRLTPEQREEKARAEELRLHRLYGGLDPTGEIWRESNGQLYGEISRHVETNGVETGEYVIGNPNKGDTNSYAVFEYEKRGDTIEVTKIRSDPMYESLHKEGLQNLANEMGQDIISGKTLKVNSTGTGFVYE